MTTTLLSQTIQERLDNLNCVIHKSDARTPDIVQLEDQMRAYIGENLVLVFVDEIGEYGVFSANESYLQDEE